MQPSISYLLFLMSNFRKSILRKQFLHQQCTPQVLDKKAFPMYNRFRTRLSCRFLNNGIAHVSNMGAVPLFFDLATQLFYPSAHCFHLCDLFLLAVIIKDRFTFFVYPRCYFIRLRVVGWSACSGGHFITSLSTVIIIILRQS